MRHDRRQDNETRAQVQKINALLFEARTLPEKMYFYGKIKRAAIVAGIGYMFNIDDYLDGPR